MIEIKEEQDGEEYLKWLKAQFKILQTKTINVGILGKEDSDLLMIANVNEFGVDITVTQKMRNYLASQGLYLKQSTTKITIPERSFIRKTADEKGKEILEFANKQLQRLINQEINANQMLNSIGQKAVDYTRDTITNGNYVANNPFTLEQKKPRTKPLVNTGTLVERIAYEVV